MAAPGAGPPAGDGPPDGGAPPGGDPPEGGHAAGARQVLAVLSVLVLVSCLVVSIFVFFGDRGNTAIAVVATVAGMAAVALKVSVTPGEIRLMAQHYGRTAVLVAGVGVLLLGSGTAWAVYSAARVPESFDFAQTVRVVGIDGSDEIGTSLPAVVDFGDAPTPDRAVLAMAFRIEDPIGSGDCSTNPGLVLTPLFGTLERPAVEVPRPGTAFQESAGVEIPTGSAIGDLTIRVQLVAPAGCRVRLVVTEAVFYG